MRVRSANQPQRATSLLPHSWSRFAPTTCDCILQNARCRECRHDLRASTKGDSQPACQRFTECKFCSRLRKFYTGSAAPKHASIFRLAVLNVVHTKAFGSFFATIGQSCLVDKMFLMQPVCQIHLSFKNDDSALPRATSTGMVARVPT